MTRWKRASRLVLIASASEKSGPAADAAPSANAVMPLELSVWQQVLWIERRGHDEPKGILLQKLERITLTTPRATLPL
jgi:hypothetical protein